MFNENELALIRSLISDAGAKNAINLIQSKREGNDYKESVCISLHESLRALFLKVEHEIGKGR